MNILLFDKDDILSKDIDSEIETAECYTLAIHGARFEHLLHARKFKLGDKLRVGKINGQRGSGIIRKIGVDSVHIDCTLNQSPPLSARAKLILALPRPKMLRRILVDIAMLGIKDVVLLNSYHVQKSYWSSPLLSQETMRAYFIRGLEQSIDTVLPRISLQKQFKIFVEDELQNFSQSEIILAQPHATNLCPQPAPSEFTLIVGPVNGFTEYEVNLFKGSGAQAYTLGGRHLRVETAAIYLLGRLL